MRQNIPGKAGSYAARHKRRSHWRRLLMALACVVVFCTTYALILPAITLENPEALDAPVCGLEEHIHSESCFEARPEAQHKQFHCCDGSGNLVVHREYFSSILNQSGSSYLPLFARN